MEGDWQLWAIPIKSFSLISLPAVTISESPPSPVRLLFPRLIQITYFVGTNDAGFSCSWNYSSEKLAVSSQDGFVSVWDMRYIHTTAQSSNPSGGSSFAGSSLGLPPRSLTTTASSALHLQRDPTKLACIPSTQNPQVKGACRTVKFSPSPSIDLLAFTEHVSYVNFVDARTFDGKQSVRVSPPGTDLHVSGVCWSPDSRGVFLGKFW